MAINSPDNETQFLANIAQGDQRAFETLYSLYSPRIYKRTLQLVRNPTLAEEVLQVNLISIDEFN